MFAASRRDFLATAGSFALAAAMVGPARAAMGPNDKFDLVIKNGDVLDPSQSLRGKRDIGIRYGTIEALEAEIPAERALRVLDAAGKLVTPGLVDLHCHVYPYGSALGIRRTSWSRTSAPPPACRPAMPARTISRRSGAISWRRRARGFMPSYTSPIWA